MSLGALGRRLILAVAVVAAVAIAIPTVALVRARADTRELERDARIARVALNTLLITTESFRQRGTIDAGLYRRTPRTPGPTLTAIVAKDEKVVASDRDVTRPVRAAAVVRARDGEDDPFTVDGVRLVALSVEGRDGSIGAVIAYEPQDALASAGTGLIAGIAVGGWLLLVGATTALIARALGPASAAAAREEVFLADAAHELRTPIAVVQARAERALRDGPGREDMEAIIGAATAAAATITDMLELARLDADRGLSERERLSFDSLVATCVQERADSGVELRVVASAPVVVEGDERLLARAVGNLLDNAVRHGRAGGVVEVAVDVADGIARLRVSDHGPGVAPSQREQIFERFQRGSAAAAGGSGLGLPIARLIARAHGGDVTIEEPRPGEPGAAFLLSVRVS